MGDDRPPRYTETAADGTEKVVYRASSLGMCDKMFVALANWYEPMEKPAWYQEILDEGTNSEDAIDYMWMNETGINTINSQMELELEVMDGVVVRCHIDGETELETESGGRVLREYKKFRPSTWPKFLRQGVEVGKTYPMQVSVMMHAGGYETCEFVGGQYIPEETDETTGIVTPAHIESVEGKVLLSPPVPLLAIKKRVAKLEEMINSGQQPQDVPCNTKMYPCPVYYLHEPGSDEAVQGDVEYKELEGDATWKLIRDEYQTITEAVSQARKTVATLEKRQKELKLGITGWLEDKEVGSGEDVKVGGETVVWVKSPRAGYEVKATVIEKLSIGEPVKKTKNNKEGK